MDGRYALRLSHTASRAAESPPPRRSASCRSASWEIAVRRAKGFAMVPDYRYNGGRLCSSPYSTRDCDTSVCTSAAKQSHWAERLVCDCRVHGKKPASRAKRGGFESAAILPPAHRWSSGGGVPAEWCHCSQPCSAAEAGAPAVSDHGLRSCAG